jgi:hypothetical protein
VDAEAKSNPMEGNTHKNVELGTQNLQVNTQEENLGNRHNNPVEFCCLENHKTCRKCVLSTKCKFFLHSSCFKRFLLQSIFSTLHLMSPGIRVGLHVKCLSVTPDFNHNQACIDKYCLDSLQTTNRHIFSTSPYG